MIKKILCGIALVAGFASCNEDYDNWANPQENIENEIAQKLSMLVTPSTSYIDFADVTSDYIQLFTTDLAEELVEDYTVTFSDADGNESVITATSEGMVTADDLKGVVTSLFGSAPEERMMTANVSAVVAIVTADGTVKAQKVGDPFALKVKLNAPFIDEGYWLVGDFNNWDAASALAFTHNGTGSVYDAPTFTITFTTTADNQYWKIIPQTNYAGDDFWAGGETGVLGPQTDGDVSMSGSLTTNSPGAGVIEKAGIYRMTIDMMNYTYTIEEMAFTQFVYFIGATDGWGASDQKLESPAFDGVYTGYIYIADPNGWGLEFKFQKVSGDWDTQLNSGSFAAITGDFENGGDNIRATAGEGVYYITLDLAGGTLHGTKINNMNLVGEFNSWNAADDAQQMTWDAENYCYVITGAGVTATGWKFTANNDWAINLGGDINALEQDDENITQVGTIIKLYPTRKTSDNIYCTIE